MQKIHRHVEILQKAGFSAYVLYELPRFRYAWRESDAPIAYFEKSSYRFFSSPSASWLDLTQDARIYTLASGKKTYLSSLNSQDRLVIPDYLGSALFPLTRVIPSVILNFTAYYTFHGRTIEQALNAWENLPYDDKIQGVLVGSQDTAQYLRFAFPSAPLYLCPFGVDSDQFSYYPQKKKQIAFMPRKCREHLTQVLHLLSLRKSLPDWTFLSLENKPQQEIIEGLQTSALFLSSSYQEGFGLPPAEALACGTLVVGYDGEGGKEFFHSPFARAIPHGNIIAFVQAIEEMAFFYENKRADFLQIGKEASSFIQKKYSLEKEKTGIVEAWKKIGSRAGYTKSVHKAMIASKE